MFMHDDSANSFIEVSQALIHFRGSYLMQLRDFKEGLNPQAIGVFLQDILRQKKLPSKPSGEKSKKNYAGNQSLPIHGRTYFW